MNINTNGFLNSVLLKLDSSLSSKTENLTEGGKTNTPSMSKNTGVQTLLNELFKDIATGTKKKSDVVTLLENSKNSLSVKTITNDLKQLVTALQKEIKNTPELEKLTTVLKNSIVDISTLDEKVLKNSVKNSGVFLESKLAQNLQSLSKNLTSITTQLQNQSSLLNTMQSEINTTVKPENRNISQTTLENTQKTLDTANIKSEIKTAIQKEIHTILQTIESSQKAGSKIENTLLLLQNANTKIVELDQKFTQNSIKNEIPSQLKEVLIQVKNNFLFEGFLGLKKTISLLSDQIENLPKNNFSEIKNEFKTLSQKIIMMNEQSSNEQKSTLLKELITHNNKFLESIKSGNIEEILKNNIGNTKNISSDLKNVLLQVQEQVTKELPLESQSKELKNTLDKLLTSIDYYQLSSYSSNTNHSFVSFLQEELEDVDIKFNNQNEDEFSCMIDLSLSQYGDLKVLLVLDIKKGLNINIGVEQEDFKEMIQNKLQLLRQQINSVGLPLLTLNIFDLKNENERSNELKTYGGDGQFDFGLDIKV